MSEVDGWKLNTSVTHTVTEKVFGEWLLHKPWPRELDTQPTARRSSSSAAWAPEASCGRCKSRRARRENTNPCQTHTDSFFFCQTPLPLPELFRNRGALRPVLWMQRFVCILPSNKSGPVLFLMKSRSGVLLRERTNTNAHTGAVRSVPLRRPVSVQGNSHLSRICLIIL